MIKPHKPFDEQIKLLLSRGLIINDLEIAESFLSKVNYYRLRGYFYPFQVVGFKENQRFVADHFHTGTTFKDVMNLYLFDQELRLLLLEVLACFEIQLRTSLAYIAGIHDPAAHLDEKNWISDKFEPWQLDYQSRKAEASHEDFVHWHDRNYEGILPIWAAVEILQFGQLSRLLRGFSQGISSEIADSFGMPSSQFKSWVAQFNDLRNYSAHHSRIWNRRFLKSPKLMPRGFAPELDHLRDFKEFELKKLYVQLAPLVYLDQEDRFEIDFTRRLIDLLTKFPNSQVVSLSSAGFPNSWQRLELWLPS